MLPPTTVGTLLPSAHPAPHSHLFFFSLFPPQSHLFFFSLPTASLSALSLTTPPLPPHPSCLPQAPHLTCPPDRSPGVQAHPFFRGLSFKMLLLRKLEAPFVPELSADTPELDVSNFDSKYTLEAPCLSPLRKPLSEGMERQFEELTLEYMSPETRHSMRFSRVSLSSRGSNGSDRSSIASSVSGSVSGSESMLRFLPKK